LVCQEAKRPAPKDGDYESYGYGVEAQVRLEPRLYCQRLDNHWAEVPGLCPGGFGGLNFR
jgi:hypothetical protein